MNYKKNVLIFFIDAWKNIEYLKILKWGVLSSLYTGILFLSIGYLTELIKNPFVGYALKSTLSNLVLPPIFLYAYIIINKKKSSFTKYIGNFYIWVIPPIILSSIASIMIILTGNIYLFYTIFSINVIYLLLSIFTPLFMFEYKDFIESIILSIKLFSKNILIFIPIIIINFALLFFITQLLNMITYEISNVNMSVGLIVSMIISLSKPLIYTLPLFNLLEVAKKIKTLEKEDVVKDQIGDVI